MLLFDDTPGHVFSKYDIQLKSKINLIYLNMYLIIFKRLKEWDGPAFKKNNYFKCAS